MKKLHKRLKRVIKIIGVVLGMLCTLFEFSAAIMQLIVQSNQM